jgi:hypothetical protein
MTDWSTDDLGEAGECGCLVGEARNYPASHLKEKIGGVTFILTSIYACVYARTHAQKRS